MTMQDDGSAIDSNGKLYLVNGIEIETDKRAGKVFYSHRTSFFKRACIGGTTQPAKENSDGTLTIV